MGHLRLISCTGPVRSTLTAPRCSLLKGTVSNKGAFIISNTFLIEPRSNNQPGILEFLC
jgi:hypothetical protein